jgi:hypothetical protein
MYKSLSSQGLVNVEEEEKRLLKEIGKIEGYRLPGQKLQLILSGVPGQCRC